MVASNAKPLARDDREAALAALYDDVHAKHMFPFWATAMDVPHDEIRQLTRTARATPYKWSFKADIEPLLRRSAALVSMSDSERRSLILCNPGLAPRRASVSTMYTAYRLNDPNEVMPPHRHSPNAVRFGLTGTQNFTGVEGENITFGPGDLVLTPHDTWHNHGNTGAEPAINLSVLDLPLVETLNAIYFEHDYKEVENGKLMAKRVQSARFPADYSARIYGAGGLMPRFVSHERGTGAASPMYVYRWDATRELLERHKDWDGDPYEALMIEYVDPTTGHPVF
jgi:gentisate 1,2-dioxygenase